mgnify:CR=1 FL=1
MQFAVDSLLDGLSELVYISDPDTYQLLFVNKAGKEAYGQDIADGTHLCYAALQNRTSPCPFCTNQPPERRRVPPNGSTRAHHEASLPCCATS